MNNVMKRWNNPKYDQQKRQYKINETYQQACFLWLLNQFCEIELEPRKHPTKRIASNPIIKTLNFNDDIIELSQLADQRCKELIKESQYPNKSNDSIMRRIDKNKKIFIHNFLIDLLVEKGYFFNFKLSKKSERGIQIQRITHIFFQNELLISGDNILKLGEDVCVLLNHSVENKTSMTFKKNDLFVSFQLKCYQ